MTPPELWCWPAGGEVRDIISEAVTADNAVTAAVETGMVPLVQGVQKTRKWVPGLLLGSA